MLNLSPTREGNIRVVLYEFSNNSEFSVAAEIYKQEQSLSISWFISGQISKIVVPTNKTPPQRKDKLWENTCFEIFLKHQNQDNYFEYNFSPNQDWNCYSFSSYRANMNTPQIATPEIKFKADQNHLIMSVRAALPEELQNKNRLAAGITAILKTDKGLTYWALNHPKDKPDFHSYFEPIMPD